ncbi:C-C motif chemokine 2-like [Pangasianodon hypophthalmus]|uniref:C-C motif chemokine 2-like n=1 Tax=Pangasianodon hypophthalmus TaxID=310915 RepID=UPI002307757B|nr:C-C motif chemokine 2-like [Pangasianodon hypophthalmus]
MSSRSLLLVLLVLFYLQFFTTAQLYAMALYECCFKYQPHPIHARLITGYKETDRRQCPKPGVIFTLKRGRHVCADPRVEWVQNIMKTIDKGSFRSWVQPEEPVTITEPVSTASTNTEQPDNPVPSPSTSRNKPVTITEPVSTASTNTEQPDSPVPPPSTCRNKPDNPVSTASTNTEPTSHPAQQDYTDEPESDKTHSPASSNIVGATGADVYCFTY